MEYEKIAKFTKWILDFMFFAGIIVVITVPLWLKFGGLYYSREIMKHYWLMLIVFVLSGLLGIFILNELRKMMRTVLEQNCFVMENVLSLKKMARYSIAISIFFAIKVAFFPTPATLIIVLVFFIAALFSLVLSCVFKQAIDYKNENDLTI
ncbi:DUF2975 domain-containing protein [Roseburia hominis]